MGLKIIHHNSDNCQKALIQGEYADTVVTASNSLTVDGTSTLDYIGINEARGHGSWSTEDIHSQEYYMQVLGALWQSF